MLTLRADILPVSLLRTRYTRASLPRPISATESSKRSRRLCKMPCGSEQASPPRYSFALPTTTWPAVCLHSLLDPPFWEGAGAAIVSTSELPISPGRRLRDRDLTLKEEGSGVRVGHYSSPAALDRWGQDSRTKSIPHTRWVTNLYTVHHARMFGGGTGVCRRPGCAGVRRRPPGGREAKNPLPPLKPKRLCNGFRYLPVAHSYPLFFFLHIYFLFSSARDGTLSREDILPEY